MAETLSLILGGQHWTEITQTIYLLSLVYKLLLSCPILCIVLLFRFLREKKNLKTCQVLDKLEKYLFALHSEHTWLAMIKWLAFSGGLLSSTLDTLGLIKGFSSISFCLLKASQYSLLSMVCFMSISSRKNYFIKVLSDFRYPLKGPKWCRFPTSDFKRDVSIFLIVHILNLKFKHFVYPHSWQAPMHRPIHFSDRSSKFQSSSRKCGG